MTPPDDVMGADEARALLTNGDVLRSDYTGTAARALRAVVALHERADAAWQAGRERAAEVCDAMAAFHHPTMRSVIAASLAERIRALPPAAPPPPPASPPEAPQRPPAPSDGGTEPGGAASPARGLPVAAVGEVLDLTDEVAALAHCPDGHHWRPGAGVERVVDIGDPGAPYLRREVVSACPRCGFGWRLSAEDA
jgi:hypothetical protein